MTFKLITDNYSDNIKVIIDNIEYKFNIKFSGKIIELQIPQGKHQIRIIKQASEKQNLIISWLSILGGISEYSWNDIKSANYLIDYTGEFYIDDNLEIRLYISKNGIDFDKPLITKTEQKITTVNNSMNIFLAYKLPIIFLLFVVYAFFIFIIITCIIQRKILWTLIITALMFLLTALFLKGFKSK